MIFKIINFAKAPFWFKKMIAKILLHCLRIEHLQNDIVLFNELKLWIETDGRPQTSNINHHINS